MTKNRCVRFNLRLCNAYHVRSHVIFREREIYESCACVMVRLTWHESLMLKFMLGLVLLVKTGLNKALMEGKINVQHAFQCIFCRVLHKTTTWNHQILGLTTTWAYNKEPFIFCFHANTVRIYPVTRKFARIAQGEQNWRNNREILAMALSYILEWRFRFSNDDGNGNENVI